MNILKYMTLSTTNYISFYARPSTTIQMTQKTYWLAL